MPVISSIENCAMALVGAGCGLVNLTDIGAFGVKGRIWFWRLLPESSLAHTTFVPSRKAESQLPLGGTSTVIKNTVCHERTQARFTGRGCSPKLVETLARRLASLATGTLAYDLARTAQTVRQATM